MPEPTIAIFASERRLDRRFALRLFVRELHDRLGEYSLYGLHAVMIAQGPQRRYHPFGALLLTGDATVTAANPIDEECLYFVVWHSRSSIAPEPYWPRSSHPRAPSRSSRTRSASRRRISAAHFARRQGRRCTGSARTSVFALARHASGLDRRLHTGRARARVFEPQPLQQPFPPPLRDHADGVRRADPRRRNPARGRRGHAPNCCR